MANPATELFLPTHPGLPINLADVYGTRRTASGAENPTGMMTSFLAGHMFGMNTLAVLGGGIPYASGLWTVTTTGTGAAAAQATHPGGGVLLTAGSDSTFNTNLQSKAAWTPVADKWMLAHGRVQSSDITTVGWEFNIGASAVDPATTNYTDVIGFKMAVGAGTVLAKVRGNAGTQVTSSTLYTMTAATDAYFGFLFKLSATTASNMGYFFYGADMLNLTAVLSVTDISGAQAQMAAMLTTPQTSYLNLHAKGSAGNPTVTFSAAMAQVQF